MTEPTYIGQLREVSFVDAAGAVHKVAVSRSALAVDGSGLYTSPTRSDATRGLCYATAGVRDWFRLTEVVYWRRRAAGPLWYHEIKGGRVALVSDEGGPPVALFDVPRAQRCDREGDYICGG